MLLSRLRKTSISINFPSVNKHYLYWQHAPCLDPATSSFPWQYFSSLLSCFLFSLSRSLKQPWLSVFFSFVPLEAIKTVERKSFHFKRHIPWDNSRLPPQTPYPCHPHTSAFLILVKCTDHLPPSFAQTTTLLHHRRTTRKTNINTNTQHKCSKFRAAGSRACRDSKAHKHKYTQDQTYREHMFPFVLFIHLD